MVHQELKVNYIGLVSDCVSSSTSSYWLDQEVRWSIKFEMRYDHRELIQISLSEKKCFLENALKVWALIMWISRIFF